jgi:hypothetical protein
MKTTPFLTPGTITQISTDGSIDWTHANGSIGQDSYQYAVSSRRLYTISGLWQERFASMTSQLWFTNFPFAPSGTTLLGIEVQLNSIRGARIQDYIVQLVLGGNRIGDNIADAHTDNYKIYGSSTSLWNSPVTLLNTIDPSFGVVLSLRSNVTIPHNDLAYLDNVAMRITYS